MYIMKKYPPSSPATTTYSTYCLKTQRLPLSPPYGKKPILFIIFIIVFLYVLSYSSCSYRTSGKWRRRSFPTPARLARLPSRALRSTSSCRERSARCVCLRGVFSRTLFNCGRNMRNMRWWSLLEWKILSFRTLLLLLLIVVVNLSKFKMLFSYLKLID